MSFVSSLGCYLCIVETHLNTHGGDSQCSFCGSTFYELSNLRCRECKIHGKTDFYDCEEYSVTQFGENKNNAIYYKFAHKITGTSYQISNYTIDNMIYYILYYYYIHITLYNIFILFLNKNLSRFLNVQLVQKYLIISYRVNKRKRNSSFLCIILLVLQISCPSSIYPVVLNVEVLNIFQ
ncbi:hypothetical protein AGLY_004002 [Aphis glycines]|uniref:C2H2-type domain-containing protein n=1 Tax=Aphis glycines TaxID=307491 RepID=A0A6G0TZA3_APHGL|nr:hypothetical protein AGLY_004002 [Aphis glycines]